MSTEDQSEVKVTQPANISLFLSGSEENTDLPEEIAKNPRLLRESSLRQKLYQGLGSLFDQIQDPDCDIDEALEKGLVSESKLADIYLSLAEFLKADSNNARVILYLPFQLLPNLKFKRHQGKLLQEAKAQFCQTYLKGWRLLLEENDVEANFIDGDILEPEFGGGKPPLVTKAAHLIPQLLEKGLIEKSPNSFARGPLAAQGDPLQPLQSQETQWKKGRELMDFILQELQADLQKGALRFGQEVKMPDGMTLGRWTWERQKALNQLVNHYAIKLAAALKNQVISENDILDFCQKGSVNGILRLVCIRGIRQAVEGLATENIERAKKICENFLEPLDVFWQESGTQTKDELATTFYHWIERKVLEKEYLTKYGLHLPKLDEVSPIDIRQIHDKLQELETIIKNLNRNKDMADIFYPVFLLFGSRFKGYANQSSDLDLAVFIRPETSWESRPQQKHILTNLLPQNKGLGKVTEFWIKKENDKLKIRKVPFADISIADKDFIHLLLGGLWFGEKEQTQTLYKDLLSDYLMDNTSRSFWLRQIEREVLQYRLLHKGYERFYPKTTDSVFFDPGYRRIATRLFLGKVFLPNLQT